MRQTPARRVRECAQVEKLKGNGGFPVETTFFPEVDLLRLSLTVECTKHNNGKICDLKIALPF